MKKRIAGFTLIELLVSISIIAILTALLTANFIGARQRGRDGQRKSNLYQIQSALELYRSDKGNYPFPSIAACGSCLSASGTCTASDTKYMQKIPCDPTTGSSFPYVSVDGSTYSIYACLENDQDADHDSSKNPACSAASFTLTNP